MKIWLIVIAVLIYFGLLCLALSWLRLERRHFFAVQAQSAALLSIVQYQAKEQQLQLDRQKFLLSVDNKIISSSTALVANHYNPCAKVVNQLYWRCEFFAIDFHKLLNWLLKLCRNDQVMIVDANINQINYYGMVAVQLTLG
jgi:type II secretory pathway component PulM